MSVDRGRRGPDESEDTMTATINTESRRGAARVGRHRSTRPRTLNLVDLENLVGGDVQDPRVREVWS